MFLPNELNFFSRLTCLSILYPEGVFICPLYFTVVFLWWLFFYSANEFSSRSKLFLVMHSRSSIPFFSTLPSISFRGLLFLDTRPSTMVWKSLIFSASSSLLVIWSYFSKNKKQDTVEIFCGIWLELTFLRPPFSLNLDEFSLKLRSGENPLRGYGKVEFVKFMVGKRGVGGGYCLEVALLGGRGTWRRRDWKPVTLGWKDGRS